MAQSQTGDQNNIFKQNIGQSSNFQGSKIIKIREFEQNYNLKIAHLKEKLKKINEDILFHQEMLNQKRDQIRDAKLKNTKNEEAFGQTIKIKDVQNKFTKKKYNEAVAYNVELRKQIDAIRMEKKLFDNIYKNLEQELIIRKDELQKVCKESEGLLENIKISQQDYMRSTNKAFNFVKEQDKEFNDIFNIIETKNREEKLKNRNADNQFNIQEMLNPVIKSPNERKSIEIQESQTKGDYRSYKKMNISNDMYNLDQIKQDVQEYQQVFENLKQQEKSNDINDIVKSFVEIEDKQASLLSFINALNDEKDNLEKEKKKLQAEIEQIKQNQKEQINDTKFSKVKVLKEQIEMQKEFQKKIDQKNKKLQSIINQLKIGIPIIFERIGCNFEEYQKEFLQTLNMKDFSENNMPFFLQFIEKQTNEIMQMYNEVFQNQPKESKEIEDNLPQIQLKENDFIHTLDKLDIQKIKDTNSNENELLKKKDLDDFAEKELAKMNIKKKKK